MYVSDSLINRNIVLLAPYSDPLCSFTLQDALFASPRGNFSRQTQQYVQSVLQRAVGGVN
jgi:hypothetical protein